MCCAQIQARDPQASFPRAAPPDRALVNSYECLIDRPDDTQVTIRQILAPYRVQPLQRRQQVR
ncbi:MAG: hypothetical protein F4Y80_01170 [Caldilineaceae bacterium SB0665_bin_21]|nr:hypothetical protein [Caldilineaceae bacterium SB0665_bin_21]